MGLVKITQEKIDSIIGAINNRAKVSDVELKASSVQPVLTAPKEVVSALSSNTIDLATASVFTKTIGANTTFTLSNKATSGQVNSFILELTNGGAYTITWWDGVKWAGGTAPVLTTAGVDILGFYSHDGGVTWRGMVLAKDSK